VVSINDQWRICFRFIDGDAYEVEISDYHYGVSAKNSPKFDRLTRHDQNFSGQATSWVQEDFSMKRYRP
jgi:hypothetical protein